MGRDHAAEIPRMERVACDQTRGTDVELVSRVVDRVLGVMPAVLHSAIGAEQVRLGEAKDRRQRERRVGHVRSGKINAPMVVAEGLGRRQRSTLARLGRRSRSR